MFASGVCASLVAAIIWKQYEERNKQIEEESLTITRSNYHHFTDPELGKIVRYGQINPQKSSNTLMKDKVISSEEMKERSNETWDMLRNVLGNSSPFENFELILCLRREVLEKLGV
jgi:hypothetical protein